MTTIDTETLTVDMQAAERVVEQSKELLIGTVRRARKQGMSWTLIGEAFGVSRQAAWERFHNAVKED